MLPIPHKLMLLLTMVGGTVLMRLLVAQMGYSQ